MLVELVPATRAQQPILSNLLQFYEYDFSEFLSLELGPDGRFAYPQLPLYWFDSARFPFLAVVDARWAGFVFIKQIRDSTGEAYIWDMAEFFVMRSFRHRGIGTNLARLAFRRFPGAWQVRVMESNAPARSFWRQAIGDFMGTDVLPLCTRADGMTWDLFAFESK